jgi:hypothetical protein
MRGQWTETVFSTLKAHPGAQWAVDNAKTIGVTRLSPMIDYPSLPIYRILSLDIQHCEGEGEGEKHFLHFSQVLETKNNNFWPRLSGAYQAYLRDNKLDICAQFPSWNHWRKCLTQEAKAAFIIRSVHILQPFVTEETKRHFMCWKLHAEYTELLFRFRLSVVDIQRLQTLIWNVKVLCVSLYGPEFVTINSHYLTHMTWFIEGFGVPRNATTFGFESLVGLFVSAHMKNTNNHSICKSLLCNTARRRALEAVIDAGAHIPVADAVGKEIGKSKKLQTATLKAKLAQAGVLSHDEDLEVQTVASVQKGWQTYVEGVFAMVCHQEAFITGKIEQIFRYRDNVWIEMPHAVYHSSTLRHRCEAINGNVTRIIM